MKMTNAIIDPMENLAVADGVVTVADFYYHKFNRVNGRLLLAKAEGKYTLSVSKILPTLEI